MVKKQAKDNSKSRKNQGKAECPAQASKKGHSTPYSYCSERLSPFGGLLGLVKFMELIQFKEIFAGLYTPPTRTPDMGHYTMVCGFIMLLFIGFNRVWHFLYIQTDSMLCSIIQVVKLPFVTTYWRYVDSLGINQGKSLLEVMSALRERVWHICEIEYRRIHIDIDTTVETIYGKQQGGRKGHNTKNRGKKGFRPVLGFIEETREYIAGKLRVGETMGGEEVGEFIRGFKKYLPGCVKEVILRGDGEFISWESVEAAEEEGYQYIFGNKGCNPPLDPLKWYKIRERDEVEYNECIYQPMGWKRAHRFVVMRKPEDKPAEEKAVQRKIFEDEKYTYREFVTNVTGKTHKVIEGYDKRADSENLIGEAKREGLAAIVSNKFMTNYAYFQIVMLSYNIWRSFKMIAGHSQLEQQQQAEGSKVEPQCAAREVIDNTIRIARLKLLFIAAKITGHSNTYEVKYSEHDSRVSGLFRFMRYLDERLQQARPWLDGRRWLPKHLSALEIKQIAFSP
ncbi:MAG: IS1380 family transposase [Candidatus Berkelbacteria bacterium]|nr:IS1380 family transposase [Candidatus Berkelbacteria bacterium]